jgi:hypothetical protein
MTVGSRSIGQVIAFGFAEGGRFTLMIVADHVLEETARQVTDK